MKDSSKHPVLAIDGGGTRCRFALQRVDGRVLAESGPANASTDFDQTLRCLQSGIQTLAHTAGTAVETLYDLPAFVGLAGVTGRSVAMRLRSALPLRNAYYADDRMAAVRGALGHGDGIVAHCGTGSFLGAQVDGVIRLAGGWGARLGDEASAQWVGRKALKKLLRHFDGFEAPSPLLTELRSQFSDAAGVVAFARDAGPSEFGTFAPRVTRHATLGDPVARSILQSGADHLATDLGHIGWKHGRTLCLTGGIGPQFGAYLPNEMQADLAPPLGEPLDGAIALAQQKEMAHGCC